MNDQTNKPVIESGVEEEGHYRWEETVKTWKALPKSKSRKAYATVALREYKKHNLSYYSANDSRY